MEIATFGKRVEGNESRSQSIIREDHKVAVLVRPNSSHRRCESVKSVICVLTLNVRLIDCRSNDYDHNFAFYDNNFFFG